MNIKEFYDSIGGNYDDVLNRIMKEDRIIKFVKRFADDNSMSILEGAIKADDCENAFAAAHTLKGVTANLSFTELNKCAEEITELLRNNKDFDGAKAYYPTLRDKYNMVLDAINKLEVA